MIYTETTDITDSPQSRRKTPLRGPKEQVPAIKTPIPRVLRRRTISQIYLYHFANRTWQICHSTEGRLQQATLDLLAGCDIQFRRETRLDIALVKNLPIALIFLPAADIPTFVGEGRVDLGITGRDQVAEHDAKLPRGETSGVEEVLDLGFGMCKLQVQVPEKGDITDPRQLIGKNIVTSFTALTEAFFAKLEGDGDPSKRYREGGGWDLSTKVKYVGGSVEAACALGVADGIVDLVGMCTLLYFPSVWPSRANHYCSSTLQSPARR